jgi:hypothetical protein
MGKERSTDPQTVRTVRAIHEMWYVSKMYSLCIDEKGICVWIALVFFNKVSRDYACFGKDKGNHYYYYIDLKNVKYANLVGYFVHPAPNGTELPIHSLRNTDMREFSHLSTSVLPENNLNIRN